MKLAQPQSESVVFGNFGADLLPSKPAGIEHQFLAVPRSFEPLKETSGDRLNRAIDEDAKGRRADYFGSAPNVSSNNWGATGERFKEHVSPPFF